MKMNLFRHNFKFAVMLLVAVLCYNTSFSAPQATIKTDSTNLMMGKMSFLHLQVVTDRGTQIDVPLFATQDRNGLISLVGDSIELRASVTKDTVSLGGTKIQVNAHIPMQAFMPGNYLLPSIMVVVGKDSIESNRVALNVVGPDVQATDSISPDFGPVDPFYKNKLQKTTDKIPDFFYYWWWAILIGIALIVLLVWWLSKRKGKTLPWQKPKVEKSPYEQAIERLRILRARNLCEQGQEKEYYSELTDILRLYLWRRFGINAMEMTSAQIRKAVRNSKDAKVGKQYIEQVLGMADFVKFAKFKPLPDDNIKAFEDAVHFVEETKPLPTTDETDENLVESDNKE